MKSLLFAPTILLTAAANAHGTTIHVPGEQPSIQAGIDVASAGDTVLVAPGIYTGDGNRDLDPGGIDIVILSASGSDVTVIDCDAGLGDSHRGFHFHRGEDSGSIIDGFTIRNGFLDNGLPSPSNTGCAILCENAASPTIIRCEFIDNGDCNEVHGGGAVSITTGSAPWLVDCRFVNNQADFGAVIRIDDSAGWVRIDDCYFTQNLDLNSGVLAFGTPPTLLVPLILVASAGSVPADTAWQLTFDPGSDQYPTWSPDGSRIAFRSDRSGNSDIWVIPAQGGVATQITTDPAMDSRPAWSPDGSQITFASRRSGRTNIWVIPASGGVATQVTTDLESASAPSWSPDGSQIAFTRESGGLFDICVIPPGGGVPTQVTTNPTWNYDAGWSPDGKRIAFTSERSGCYEVWVIPASGGTATQITDEEGGNPTWSPDGSRMAFESWRGGNWDLWVIDVSPVAVEPATWGGIKALFR